MTERGVDEDLRAVDRAVLGVGDGDRVLDLVAVVEDRALRRQVDLHRRGGVARGDVEGRRSASWPVASVIVRVAVRLPAVVYVYVGLMAVESVVPSPSKSHAYVSGVPSGSSEPSAENLTVSGAGPDVLSAVALTIGERAPET